MHAPRPRFQRTMRSIQLAAVCLAALAPCCPTIPQGPAADFRVNPEYPAGGYRVEVADRSELGDATCAAYLWDFGDGGAAVGPLQQHDYAGPGRYTITLTLRTDKGVSKTEREVDLDEFGYSWAVPLATWRVLLVVLPETDIQDCLIEGESYSYSGRMSDEAIGCAVSAFYGYASLAQELSHEKVWLEADHVILDAPLTEVSTLEGWGAFLAAENAQSLLNDLDATGQWDSFLVLWEPGSLPFSAWGMGSMFTEQGSTFCCIASPPDLSWWNECHSGEVYIHEWLHCVNSYFASQGFSRNIPEMCMDGAELYGYEADEIDGWTEWDGDVMNGQVWNGWRYIGHTATMWRLPPPRASTE